MLVFRGVLGNVGQRRGEILQIVQQEGGKGAERLVLLGGHQGGQKVRFVELAGRVARKRAQKLPRLAVIRPPAPVGADGDDPGDPVARHQRDQERGARLGELLTGAPFSRSAISSSARGSDTHKRFHDPGNLTLQPARDQARGGQKFQPVRVPAPHPNAHVDRPQRPVHDVGQGRRRLGRGVDRTHPLGGLEPEVAVVVAAREDVAPDPGPGPVPQPGPQDQGGQDDGGQEEDQRLERQPHLSPAAAQRAIRAEAMR